MNLRGGPFRDGAFRSPLHDERLAAVLGLALAATFATCFATGVVSHLIQHPPGWFQWPSRPAGLYRVSQGLHVAAGIASIPVLGAKLWVVYPRLFTWPPVEGMAHGLERAGLFMLVGGSLFMLFTGVANVALWYPFGFFFPAGHYAGAWITAGGLVAHVGAKAATTRRALSAAGRAPHHLPPTRPAPGGDAALTRRGLLAAVFAAAGALTLATIGQTVSPLRRLSWLAPRLPDTGPQGFPVNKTAQSAGVTDTARDARWRLEVSGAVERELRLSRRDLAGMRQHEVELPIACVEGWSTSQRWTGVPVRDILALAGAPDGCEVDVESIQRRGRYRRSVLNPPHARDPDTVLALAVNGETLHLDHGFPVRLIGPNRPGVMQTKWIGRLAVRG